MPVPPIGASPQPGLLDLSIDLSVPEVASGSDFTLYLHVRNPFDQPIWIRTVDLSLPVQLLLRSKKGSSQGERDSAETEKGPAASAEQIEELKRITEAMAGSDGGDQAARARLDQLADDLADAVRADRRDTSVSARGESVVNVYGGYGRDLDIVASDSSVVNIRTHGAQGAKVSLAGSLGSETALEAGCTDVWTIRLGTSKSPFFLPASYRLQATIAFAFGAPTRNPEPAVKESGEPEADSEGAGQRSRVFSNTTSFVLPVRAALWKVMLGGAVGGAAGSIARSLQDLQNGGAFGDLAQGTAVGALLLAVILSGVAIVFAARRAPAQTFVTVEDFWGGLLVGFLIGYSGTVVFSDLTGV